MPRLDQIQTFSFEHSIRTAAARRLAETIASEIQQVMTRNPCSLELGIAALSAHLAAAIGAEATGSNKRRDLTVDEMARAMHLAGEVRDFIERQLLDWGKFGRL